MKLSLLKFRRFALLVVLTVASLMGCKRDPLADVPERLQLFVPAGAMPADIKLIVAMMEGKVSDFEAALSEGGNIRIAMSNGETPLQYIVKSRNQQLLNAIFSRMPIGEVRRTFVESANKGEDRVLEALIPQLKSTGSDVFQDALMSMADSGEIRTIKVEATYKNDDGRRLTKEATRALDILLKNGAQINKASIYGETPLMAAAKTNRAEMAYELLLRGANWKAKNKAGKTALDVARASRAGDRLYGSIIPLLEQWQAGKISAPRSTKAK